MTSHPRVLHIVWNLIRGGTEGQCARVAMALARRGGKHRVAVFRREGYFLEAVERTCGPIYHVDIRNLARPRTIMELLKLDGFIQRDVFDVVHAWDADAAIFGHLAARWAEVPFITSRRDLGQIYPAWKTAMMRRADRVAAAVVVNAEAIRSLVLAQGVASAKIHTIPNLLDLDEFDALAGRTFDPQKRLPDGQLVVMVARLDPEKDAETLIRAAERVCKKRHDAFFVVAGDGPQKQQLEVLTARLGIERQVIFLGDVKDVPSLLCGCHIGVLVPKANEGLSNSILEYMAARLPVVASDCGGNRELVRDGETGFIVQPGDVNATAEAILRLLDDPSLARSMGERGRLQASDVHRPDVVVDQFEKLYRTQA